MLLPDYYHVWRQRQTQIKNPASFQKRGLKFIYDINYSAWCSSLEASEGLMSFKDSGIG